MGTGEPCTTDKNCGESAVSGACVLGTCFGLLTTESQPVRATLVGRLSAAPATVRTDATTRLLKALSHPMSSAGTRVGAIEGLGAVQRLTGDCGPVCLALRKATQESDQTVAVSARLALARRADPTVLGALLEDAKEGTEHLRCSAVRAFRPYLRAGLMNKVLPTLLQLLTDKAPGVRRVAAETLAPWRAQAAIGAALEEAAAAHPGDLRYIVDRARLKAGATP